jgi:hypothetical protein
MRCCGANIRNNKKKTKVKTSKDKTQTKTKPSCSTFQFTPVFYIIYRNNTKKNNITEKKQQT